ncbi:MAG TPA: hypothetical protein VKU80_18270 [Planctomycetota bacterium]|nr:hypothetical protein [Planctomycetota bacterium]
MAAPRKYLGRDQNLAGIIRVYLLADSLEIDELTFAEIERTRVYFDDVLAVTYHRAVSMGFSILMGLGGGIFGAIGVVLVVHKEWAGAVSTLVAASPFLLTFVAHLILKTDFITVFGRRTLARMRFRVRKGRAREVYKEITDKVRIAQAAAAAAQPPPPPPEAPELPPGPPLAANPS